MKEEKFTNQSGGYMVDTSKCGSLTLKDCLNTSSCVWCMKKDTGFNSQCIPGNPNDQTIKQQCNRVYANDIWTRSVISNDNDYQHYLDMPIME
jgi:hypothetical protein